MLHYLWSLYLEYEFLSTPLFQLIVTTFQTFTLSSIFWLMDSSFMSQYRLKVPVSNKSDHSRFKYKNFFRFAFYNTVFLWFTILGSSTIIDMKPDRTNWPLEAPSLLAFVFQLLVVIIVIDFIMYWIHRLFHYGILYKFIHSVHHANHDSVAINAMCTHPIEFYTSMIVFFMVPVVLTSIGLYIHPLTANLSYFMINVHGIMEHCGYHDFSEPLTLGLLTGSKTHIVHHNFFGANYGFYTSIWDHVFKTSLPYETMVHRLSHNRDLVDSV